MLKKIIRRKSVMSANKPKQHKLVRALSGEAACNVSQPEIVHNTEILIFETQRWQIGLGFSSKILRKGKKIFIRLEKIFF